MPKFNKNQVKLKDAYKFYKESVKNPVSYPEYKLILDTWGELVVSYLAQGRDVKLHRGMSVLAVRKHHKPVYVDMLESQKQGKKVSKSNVKSGFFGVRVFWRRHYTTFNSKDWSFKPSRLLLSRLHDVMKEFRGHKVFLIKAQVARNPEQTAKLYNKKVHKI